MERPGFVEAAPRSMFRRVGEGLFGFVLLTSLGFGARAGYDKLNEAPHRDPSDQIKVSAEDVYKKCGQAAIQSVLKNGQTIDISKLDATKLAELNGLDKQLADAEKTCFDQYATAVVTGVEANMHPPTVQGTLQVTAK